jgi:hypothetical protein
MPRRCVLRNPEASGSGLVGSGVVADWPELWTGVFHYLENLADAKLNAADYAIAVRKVYDVLVEDCGEAEELHDGLLSLVSVQHERGRISRQYRDLVVKLLPTPPRRKRGRPKGALGDDAYNKRYQLYLDWIDEKTLNPSLTKEQFAQKRLGITDEDFAGPYEIDHRAKMDALLQDLKPTRMKQLDAGQRRAIETIYPLLILHDQYLALKWREAKQYSPALTKEDFLQELFGWPRDRKRHPMEADMIRDYLEKLDQGEKQLAAAGAKSNLPAADDIIRGHLEKLHQLPGGKRASKLPATNPKRKRNRAR